MAAAPVSRTSSIGVYCVAWNACFVAANQGGGMIHIDWWQVMGTIVIVGLVFGTAWFVAYVAILSRMDRRYGDVAGREARKNVRNERG
jgi:hypothetical protein